MHNFFAWIDYIGTGLILALAVWLIIWLNVYARQHPDTRSEEEKFWDRNW